MARENGGKRVFPDFQTDVRGRRGRKNEGTIVDANACGVSHESDPFARVQVADVVRSMPGRVDHIEFARAQREDLATLEDADIFLGHGKSFAEELMERVGPKAYGAGQQLGGVNYVRRAEFVNVNGEPRIFAHQRAGSAGVIEMDVREQNGIELRHGKPARLQAFAKRGKSRSRTGVDDRAVAVRFQQSSGNGMRMSNPVGVEDADVAHGQT